jgi:hypothetical protein
MSGRKRDLKMQSYESPETGAISKAASSKRLEAPADLEQCQRIAHHYLEMDRSEECARRPVLGPLTQGHRTSTGRVGGARRLALCGVSLVVIWSLAEMLVELAVLDGDAIAPLLFSKALLAGIGVGAAWGARWAERIFAFICITSLLAVVPALPYEMTVSPVVFFCSFVECIVKAVAFATFVCSLGDSGPNRHKTSGV